MKLAGRTVSWRGARYATLLFLCVLGGAISCDKEEDKKEAVAAKLTTISILPTTATLTVGATQTFAATGVFDDGTSTDVTPLLTWTSASGDAIAQADTSTPGKFTAKAAGSDTVTATSSDNVTATATVTVQEETAASASDPASLSAAVSATTTITLTWTAGANATGYQIAYNASSTAPTNCTTGTVIAKATIGSAKTYAITGLAEGTAYSFRVCSINSASKYSTGSTVSATTGSFQRIFTTLNSWTGNMGGLAGADANCTTEATAAGLGGTWKAILSSSATTAAARISITSTVKNMRPAGSGGPEIVATSAADMWDGTIGATLEYNASGGSPVGTNAWTATTSVGGYAGTSCTDWGATGGSAYSGAANWTNGQWIYDASRMCNNFYKLYCINGQ